jgi:2-hydroxychromene-2-carboxylate isomerase
MAAIVEFYFFYGSIHSYLTVMRIDALAASAHITLRGQPFNLRKILIEQNNTAFTKNEVKMNYFWHDVERRAHPSMRECKLNH